MCLHTAFGIADDLTALVALLEIPISVQASTHYSQEILMSRYRLVFFVAALILVFLFFLTVLKHLLSQYPLLFGILFVAGILIGLVLTSLLRRKDGGVGPPAK